MAKKSTSKSKRSAARRSLRDVVRMRVWSYATNPINKKQGPHPVYDAGKEIGCYIGKITDLKRILRYANKAAS